MPSRFPTGLNSYKGENPLSILPVQVPLLSGWSTWSDDFERYAGWTTLADSTGTANLYASTNATEAVHGNGLAQLLTAAAAADKVTIYPTTNTANTLANLWSYFGTTTASIAGEFVFATAFSFLTSADTGFAIGCATGSSVNSAGTAGDMTAGAVGTNGFYIAKVAGASGGGDLRLIWRRGAAAISGTPVTLLAQASVAAATRYKVVVHHRGGVMKCWLNDALITQVNLGTTATSPSAGTTLAPFIQAKCSPTAAAETLLVDYVMWASRSKNNAAQPDGRV